MFDTDWSRANACGIGRYIYRMDDGDDGGEEDGFDEVEETAEVLWEFHDLLYTIFDYYGAMGASDDITHMTMNAFAMFVGDCQLSDKHSQYCKPTAFDQLFISVDASGAGKDTGEKFNRKKVEDATTTQAEAGTLATRRAAPSDGPRSALRCAHTQALNRQEFVQAVVKIACMRFVQPLEILDVSEATHRLFSAEIEPRLDPCIFTEANDFRTRYIYKEEADGARARKRRREALGLTLRDYT